MLPEIYNAQVKFSNTHIALKRLRWQARDQLQLILRGVSEIIFSVLLWYKLSHLKNKKQKTTYI